MKFFLDHDVLSDMGRVLRRKGHVVTRQMVVITCNRRDFLRLAATEPHVGMIILVRRRTRAAECAAVLRLLERAGESGIANNINFA